MVNKNNLPHIVMVVSFVVFIVLGLACSTPPRPLLPQEKSESQSSDSRFNYEDVEIPAKDFVSLGMIFATATLTTTSDQNNSSSTRTTEGERFMYYRLLEKAHALGADAIVNVSVDKLTSTNRVKVGNQTNNVVEEKWFGSALAIKYTGAIALNN
jgi:hypothetical protein